MAYRSKSCGHFLHNEAGTSLAKIFLPNIGIEGAGLALDSDSIFDLNVHFCISNEYLK